MNINRFCKMYSLKSFPFGKLCVGWLCDFVYEKGKSVLLFDGKVCRERNNFIIFVSYIMRCKNMDFVKNRRTIRKYKADDIPLDLLNELLEDSFRASTMGNMQLYSVVVTRDMEMKKRLAPAHFNQPMITTAPVVLTFCADFNRFSKWCCYRKAEPGYANPISFLNAASDTLLVTQHFCTLAEAKGLGICYLGTTIYNPDKIIEILQLPELVMPVATITVGYPAEYPSQPDRLPITGIVHEEVYKDYTPMDIDRIYAYKESLAENQYFVKENGKETLAQVFTDVRYKKSDNEYMSDGLEKTLKKQGFK